MVIGIVQVIILIAFLLGYWRGISYLLIFLMHGGSTLASWRVYAALYGESGNLLFWAAIPVLAAMWVQYALRRHDTISLDGQTRDAGA
jgi:putative oxidoreductase